MPQRIPSPRELQYHTQSIMQNALIRKKLEEQRENFRKRQEQEKQEIAKKSQHDITSTSPADTSNEQQNTIITTIAPSQQEEATKNPIDSPNKKVISSLSQSQIQRQHAPSPNIFTPTSVLRKMTAEKESDAGKQTSNVLRIDDKKKQVPNMQQQHSIRNQMPQPFMNNMSSVDRMKIQNEAFGWEPHQVGGIKPPGKCQIKVILL